MDDMASLLPSTVWSAWGARLKNELGGRWITPAQYLVLMALGTLIFSGLDNPTLRQLVAESGLARSTVQRAIAAAKLRGLLVVAAQHDEGRQLANEYKMKVPEGPVVPKPRPPGGVLSRAPSQDKEASKQEKAPKTLGPGDFGSRRDYVDWQIMMLRQPSRPPEAQPS